MNSRFRAVEHGELAGLFFLQSLAAGSWLVTLTSVLEAHGLAELRSYAYATTEALGWNLRFPKKRLISTGC